MSTIKEKILSLLDNERFISFEFFPPKTETGFYNLLARLYRMLVLNPLFITVTWGSGGSTSEKSLELAIICQKYLKLTTVLHLTCTNTNKEIIDNALKKAKENGIRNILALRGDPSRNEEYWTPNCEFSYAVDLVKYIKKKYGNYFCIGVAGYPEGHVNGSDNSNQDPKNDIKYLIKKVEAGADFIITQLFFDYNKFISYENLIRSYPQLKDIILIPGLMPIATYEVFNRATKLAHASIPNEIISKLNCLGNDDDLVKKVGIDILTDIISKIDSNTNGRIKGYHFYCLNLEKAVASILKQSEILNIMENVDSNTLFTDIEDDEDDVKFNILNVWKRKSSSIINNNNSLANESLSLNDIKFAEKNLIDKSSLHDKKILVDISTGKGTLGKDATWDDFPNGRFGDSNSPAYGEINGYGSNLKIHSSKEAITKWGNPETTDDIKNIIIGYLTGKIDILPWVNIGLSPETALIQEELFKLNKKGWFSVASQPAVNSCPSSDKIFGWGPNNGIVYQKSFVELFIPKKEWNEYLYPKLKKFIDVKTITYYKGDSNNNIESNLSIDPDCNNSKNAITWGVFPLKEVLQPTIIDYQSFKAWNEEAFLLWLEWAKCYKKSSRSYELLNLIYNNYYLISLLHHDFKDEYALWNILLDIK